MLLVDGSGLPVESPVEGKVVEIYHYLQGLIHARWCRISFLIGQKNSSSAPKTNGLEAEKRPVWKRQKIYHLRQFWSSMLVFRRENLLMEKQLILKVEIDET